MYRAFVFYQHFYELNVRLNIWSKQISAIQIVIFGGHARTHGTHVWPTVCSSFWSNHIAVWPLAIILQPRACIYNMNLQHVSLSTKFLQHPNVFLMNAYSATLIKKAYFIRLTKFRCTNKSTPITNVNNNGINNVSISDNRNFPNTNANLQINSTINNWQTAASRL